MLNFMQPTHEQASQAGDSRNGTRELSISVSWRAAYVPSMNTVAVEGVPVSTRGLAGVCMFTVKSSRSSLNASGMMVMDRH